MRSEGYGTWSVRLCALLTLTLELQATKQHAYGTLVFSATTARKIMWPIWLKRLRSGKRDRHRPGPSFVTQPINYHGAHAYLLHARLALSRQEQHYPESCVAVNATSSVASLFQNRCIRYQGM